ncbi:TdeIII family type II restriction endonuclease [Hugenholtzia roseola]|uniref:TdeIII family type II restriction endonuclease n=1 Tax=Hugenholtzia roseola TaxID=1002 RepID=UPI00040FEFCC|nr:TdeIII family type II restriction endonuclease [Hugenholtzia roseola]
MAATVQTLIKKGFSVHLKGLSGAFKQKIDILAHHFGSLDSFLAAKREDFENITFIGGEKAIKLTESDFEKIIAFQRSGLLDSKLSIRENFIKVLVSEFVNRQLQMIENLELETLNINPILAGALNLDNEKDLIRYYVYQAISRSVVTSVGFLVQNLILYASEYVHEGKEDELGEQTKWDIVVEKVNEVKAYLEIKSGTNDVNKTQMQHYKREIELIENQGFRAFIGETYGKREDKTVTHGLMKQYLPDWDKRTLIGKELWGFITDDKDYHHKLVEMLLSASKHVLSNQTIIDKIESRMEPILDSFQTKYTSYDQFLKSLW